MNWLITGANGHLGRKLIEACGGQHRIVALVRSERALQQLSGLPCEAVITDYRNVAELTAELSMLDVEAWDALIGLTGTIWGKGPSDYYAAHESVSNSSANSQRGFRLAAWSRSVFVALMLALRTSV